MKRTCLVLYGSSLVSAFVLLAGCNKENPVTQGGARDAASPVVKTASANRRLILSQPATNRREWIVQTLLQGYRDTGRSNVNWDNSVQRAFEAFADYSRVNTTNWPILKKALGDVSADCDDPMIQYMRMRYSEESQSKEKTAADFVQVYEVVRQSEYHPVFKFSLSWEGLCRPWKGESVPATDDGLLTATWLSFARHVAEDFAA